MSILVSFEFLQNALRECKCSNCGANRTLFWNATGTNGFENYGEITCRSCKWSVELQVVPGVDLNRHVVAAQKLAAIHDNEFNRFVTLVGFGGEDKFGTHPVSWDGAVYEYRKLVNQRIIDEADKEESNQLDQVVRADKKVSASYDMTYMTRGHHSLIGHGAIIIDKKVVKSSTQKRTQFEDQNLDGYGEIAYCNANQMEVSFISKPH